MAGRMDLGKCYVTGDMRPRGFDSRKAAKQQRKWNLLARVENAHQRGCQGGIWKIASLRSQ